MSQLIQLPGTDLRVSPLCLGGNVFGWSADEGTSKTILSTFLEHGGNFVDTADSYSEWAPGNSGGESETIIGKWLKESHARDQVVIATKVAKYSKRPGLGAANIRRAVEDSLRRLQTEYLDIYYAHQDDEDTHLEETLNAFDQLVRSGKVKYIAASNYSGARLEEALQVSAAHGFAPYIAIQNQYNLLERDTFESDIAPVLEATGLSAIPFYGLARGFLTGKYRKGVTVNSVRARGVENYQDDRGWRVVAALAEIAETHSVSLSAIALAWLRAQKTVSVPIASARNLDQLADLMQFVELTQEELATLSDASA